MTRQKYIEIILLYVYWIISALLALHFKFSFLEMIVVYLLIPATYLSWRNLKFIKGSLVEAFFYSVPMIIVFDFIATFSRAWVESTQFSFRILGLISFENLLWGFGYILLLINFYSYFFDNRKEGKLNKSYIKLILLIILVDILFFLIYFLNKNLLYVKYFYAYIAAVFIIGTLIGLFKYPQLFLKTVSASLILLPIGLIHEFVSLKLGHWYFEAGNHIAYMNFFGYALPIEELVWIVMATPFVIIIHEYFADNLK